MEQSHINQTVKIILSALFSQSRSLPSQKDSVKAKFRFVVDMISPYAPLYFTTCQLLFYFSILKKTSPQIIHSPYVSYIFHYLSIIYYILLDCKILCSGDYTVHMLHIYFTVNHLLYFIILQQILLCGGTVQSICFLQMLLSVSHLLYYNKLLCRNHIVHMFYVCISLCVNYTLYFSLQGLGIEKYLFQLKLLT